MNRIRHYRADKTKVFREGIGMNYVCRRILRDYPRNSIEYIVEKEKDKNINNEEGA